MNDERPHLSETDASGGKKLGVMRYVLGASMLLVIIAFAVILMAR
jgi:hypothetical protein